MGGRQIAILGKHPSGGSYLWPDGFGPERLAPPPDDWWDLTVKFLKKFDRKKFLKEYSNFLDLLL